MTCEKKENRNVPLLRHAFSSLTMRALRADREAAAVVGETAWNDARGGLAIRLVPNCSLTPGEALALFGSLCLVSLAIAGFFAAQGLWPVLPFAGLELTVLGWALCASLRRRHCSQTVTVTDGQVEVVTRDQRGARAVSFSRHWSSVRLVRGTGWQPSRLVIESQGRACEVGALLTEDERRELHARLRRVVGVVNESPRLEAAGSA
jgi:uncharacterized membrane protein